MNTNVKVALFELMAKAPTVTTTEVREESLEALEALMDKVITNLIKVGEITYEDLNDAGGGTTITTTFEGGKPADSLFKKGFVKIITPFSSYTEGDDFIDKATLAVTGGGDTDEEQDVKCVIKFAGGGANPEDWTAGKLAVYIIADNIPVVE